MAPKEIPEPWCSFLKELDATLTDELCFHCIGGFVVTLLYGLPRTTSDIDVLAVMARDERFRKLLELGGEASELHAKHGVALHCVTIATVPDSYEERLIEMFPGKLKHLRLFALDPYDLALSKLERNIQRDRDDIKHLARIVPLDLSILQRRYQTELRAYLARPERGDLTLRLWIEAIEEDRDASQS